MNEKKTLLSQLKIDRDDNKEKSISLKAVIILMVIMLTVGLGIGAYFLGADSPENNNISSSSVARDDDKTPSNSLSQTEREVTDQNDAKTDLSPVSNSGNSENPILNASGYITARRMATVSAELTGRIIDVYVEEGMKVEEGQILATLDDAIAQVNLKIAKGQAKSFEIIVESAEASYEEAKRVLARVSSLKSNDFSSEARLTESSLNVEITKAELARARSNVNVAREQVSLQQEILDNHTIRAPFSGIVTIKNAQQGEIVSPGSAGGGFTRTGICTIVDMTSLEIEADVNEAFIGKIYAGQRVTASLDAYPNWEIPASVIAIIPTANRSKATVTVRIKIEVEDPRILPDMGIKMSFYE